MAEFVRMPQKGLTEESAILSRWYVKKGDEVRAGQLLFALETGKATFDVESEAAGTVLELRGNEGDEIAVKAVVCVIGSPGEKYVTDAEVQAAAGVSANVFPAAGETGGLDAPSALQVAASRFFRPRGSGKPKISPRARRLAAQSGIDAASVAGTGPGGRIIEEDVRSAAAAASGRARAEVAGAFEATGPVGEYAAVRHSGFRKAVATNMMRSLHDTAQFTMTSSFDATELLGYRERFNAGPGGPGRLTINDLVVFAVSRVLPAFPFMNAHYREDELRTFASVHIGVAVDTEKGLYVPVLRNADKTSLVGISAAVKDLAARCREGRIGAEELSGATFTVTNVGAYGIEYFTPILNPPEVAILGVGRIDYRRKKTPAGMADYPAVGLSLTTDHRAVDGGPAARFMAALISELESFSPLLAR